MGDVSAFDTAILAVVLVVPGWIVFHVGRWTAGVHTDSGLIDVSKAVVVWSIVANVVFVSLLGLFGVRVDGLSGILLEVYGVNWWFVGGWLAVSLSLGIVYAGVLITDAPRRFQRFLQRGQPIKRYTDSEWRRFFDDARYVRVHLTDSDRDGGPTIIAGNVKQWSRWRKDGELVLTMPWQQNEGGVYEPIVAENEDRVNLPDGSETAVWRESRVLIPESRIHYVVKMPVPPDPESN